MLLDLSQPCVVDRSIDEGITHVIGEVVGDGFYEGYRSGIGGRDDLTRSGKVTRCKLIGLLLTSGLRRFWRRVVGQFFFGPNPSFNSQIESISKQSAFE